MPALTSQELKALRETYVPQGPANLSPYFAASAQGALVKDVDGRELIDFVAGIGVVNVGHAHPKVVAAIQEQAARFTHTCFHIVMYESYLRLAQRLCELAPTPNPSKALLANTGAEAVENAVKIARRHTGRPGVVVFENGFHGRTLLTMTMTSKVKPYKFGFGPFAPEVYRMPYAYCYRCPIGLSYPSCGAQCADLLRDLFISHSAAENLACLVVEPVQGEGGFVAAPGEYMAKLAAICADNGIMFVADEVQTGFGRTGTLFAMEQHGLTPDLVCTAKSLAGGMPLSAVVGRAEVMDASHVGGLGGTYGGNPVACAAALAVIDVFETEDLLPRAQALGQKVRARFEEFKNKYAIVGDVRGMGPMLALELVTDREKKTPAPEQTKALSRYCVEKGLLLLACGNYGNVIRILMPLVIDDELLERGLAILEEGLAKVDKL